MVHLEEEKPEGVENEAVEQLVFADRVLLNKIDLVKDEEELVAVEKAIRGKNAAVEIIRCEKSQVDPARLLNINGFSLKAALEKDPEFMDLDGDHQHDDSVTNVGVQCMGAVRMDDFQRWIQPLLQERGADIFRSKGQSDRLGSSGVH